MKEKSPKAQPQKEKSPEPSISSQLTIQVTVAPPSQRPTELVPMASLGHADIPSQLHVSDEGEIPQSEPQASPTREEPHVSVPSSIQPHIPEEQPQ